MPNAEFKLLFNNSPASQSQLDRIEEITVEQEVDLAWGARLRMSICLDSQGNWKGEDEPFMKAFSRVRVEARVGQNSFVPLIDGPVVGFDIEMDSEPGKSSGTLIVQDDSVFLNRVDDVSKYEKQLDHEAAAAIFNNFQSVIKSLNIEPTSGAPGPHTPPVVQLRTAMEILRYLAAPHGFSAYVFPGATQGQSVGCFKQFPEKPDGLPPLILLGPKRNMDRFIVHYNAQSASEAKISILSLSDKKVTTRTAKTASIGLLGDQSTFQETRMNPAVQFLRPGSHDRLDIEKAATAKSKRTSYSYEATGATRGQCYTGILRPYEVVTVQAGNTPVSGDYEIHKVTHTLTRSVYSQSFSLKRNATSKKLSAASSSAAGSIA